MTDTEPPSYAVLQAGVTGKDLLAAITKSGYPFQTEIADQLRTELSSIDGSQIQEEWAYIDSDSGNIRALDIFAEVPLWNINDAATASSSMKIRPYLNLLVECKQSEYPYVFFLRTNPPAEEIKFPDIAGVASQDLRIFTERADSADSLSSLSINMSLHDVFGSHNLEAFQGFSFYSISIARLLRSGKKLELSGEESYRGLTFPLMKAADHVRLQSQPPEEAKTIAPKFMICLAVIRAPLIGVYLYKGKTLMLGVPWVRASRVEPVTTASSEVHSGTNVRHYDVVHSSFFSEYVRLMLNDASTLAERMLAHDEEVYSGRGLMIMDEQAEGTEEPEVYETLQRLPPEYEQFLTSPVAGRITRQSRGIKFVLPESSPEIPEDAILYVARSLHRDR